MLEQGTCQGRPMASAFFNLGIALLIETVETKTNGIQCWYMDNGFFVGSIEEIQLFWKRVN